MRHKKKLARRRHATPTTRRRHAKPMTLARARKAFSKDELQTLDAYLAGHAAAHAVTRPAAAPVPAVAPAEAMILLDTVSGVCAILPSEVISIGSVFEKGSLPDQRLIYLRGGHKQYVLDSRVNVEKLVGQALAAKIGSAPLHPSVSGIQGLINKTITKPGKYRGPKPEADVEAESEAELAPAPSIRKQLRASVKAQTETQESGGR